MNSRGYGHLMAWPVVLVWMGVLYFLSSQPSLPQALAFDFGDKIAHAVAFGILACFLSFARLPYTLGSIRRVLLVSVFVFAYGVSDEFHQSFVPGRDASTSDVIADGIGGFVAALLTVWLQRRPW
ncbi:MAG: VanZ family protein [Alphaproteobacteria bacterium]|nr:VanZ family protein [Alphaproteobacteria bacterium]